MSKSWKMLGAAVVMVGGMSSMAIADGYEYEPVTDYAPAPPVYSWTGTYIGFNAGWIRSESSATVSGGTGIFSNAFSFIPIFVAPCVNGWNDKMMNRYKLF